MDSIFTNTQYRNRANAKHAMEMWNRERQAFHIRVMKLLIVGGVLIGVALSFRAAL